MPSTFLRVCFVPMCHPFRQGKARQGTSGAFDRCTAKEHQVDSPSGQRPLRVQSTQGVGTEHQERGQSQLFLQEQKRARRP